MLNLWAVMEYVTKYAMKSPAVLGDTDEVLFSGMVRMETSGGGVRHWHGLSYGYNNPQVGVGSEQLARDVGAVLSENGCGVGEGSIESSDDVDEIGEGDVVPDCVSNAVVKKVTRARGRPSRNLLVHVSADVPGGVRNQMVGLVSGDLRKTVDQHDMLREFKICDRVNSVRGPGKALD